jgi:MFS family permease
MSEGEPVASTATVAGIALASALVPLNSTMIAVALPTIADDFDVGTGRAGLLVTVYLVAMLIGQPFAGRVADVLGARRLARIAVVGFGACSAFAALAGTFPLLLVARTAQAVFASALTPSVQSMLRAVASPDDRGSAFGIQGSVIGVGAGLGPVIGGVLIALFDWPAIFWVNLPIAAVVLVVLHRSVPDRATVATRVDVGELERAAVPSSGARVTNRVVTAAFATQVFSTLAQYALLLITPIVLDDRGWGSGAIGFATSALTLGMIVTGPLGGRLGDVRGRRFPVVAGIAIATLAVALPAIGGDDTSSAVLIVALALFGVGLGTATPSILTAGIEAAPEGRIGLASGVLSASRYVGSIVASVLLTVLVGDTAEGAGAMLAVCVASLLVSLATAFGLPMRPQRRFT